MNKKPRGNKTSSAVRAARQKKACLEIRGVCAESLWCL